VVSCTALGSVVEESLILLGPNLSDLVVISMRHLLSVLTLLIFGCQTVPSTNPDKGLSPNSILPKDAKRNVLSFAEMLEPVLPSVVRIGTLRNTTDSETPQLVGVGSGAVIDLDDGYVITNAHVVDGGDAFVVEFTNGRAAEAELIGADPATDIALLSVSEIGETEIAIADSDSNNVSANTDVRCRLPTWAGSNLNSWCH